MFNSEPTHLRYPVLGLKDKSRFPVHLFYRVPKRCLVRATILKEFADGQPHNLQPSPSVTIRHHPSPSVTIRHHPSPLVPSAPCADAPARNGGMGTKKVIPWRSWKRSKIGYPYRKTKNSGLHGHFDILDPPQRSVRSDCEPWHVITWYRALHPPTPTARDSAPGN